jgi:hypothetical protein
MAHSRYFRNASQHRRSCSEQAARLKHVLIESIDAACDYKSKQLQQREGTKIAGYSTIADVYVGVGLLYRALSHVLVSRRNIGPSSDTLSL